MTHKRLLLLEDDVGLHETVKEYLELHGFEVLSAFDAYRAEELLYEERIDLMLLDIKVPKESGLDLLQRLRKNGNKRPAIFITSLNGVEDVSRGFDAECDDYIRKPFALKELLVRIKAQLRKHYRLKEDRIRIDAHASFDPSQMRLYIGTETVMLTNKESRLLALFLENPDTIVSYETIFNELWEYAHPPSPGSLRAYVKRLRKLLGKERIETIKNIGYRFVS